MKKLEELVKYRASEIKIENELKAAQDEARRKEEAEERKKINKIVIIILLVIVGLIAIVMFINWVSQFSGTEIALTVFIILAVIGLIGKLFGE